MENSNSLKIHGVIAELIMAWKACGGINQIGEG